MLRQIYENFFAHASNIAYLERNILPNGTGDVIHH